MKKISVSTILFGLLALALTLIFIQGIASVPFHPDEATQIYMSADVEQFFQDPAGLVWQPERTGDPLQRYRLLDAPLTRYLIGLARRAAGGLPPISADWDWSKSWSENELAGALPSGRLLAVARLPGALLFPLGLLLVYRVGMLLGSRVCAWAAGLLYGLNALIWLHGRRAMAEPILLLMIILTTWFVLDVKKRIWLAAIPAALAFCAKQSAIVLLLPCLVAILWQADSTWANRVRRTAAFLGLYAAIVIALNPFLWSHPVQAATAAVEERSALVQRQVDTLTAADPALTLRHPAQRLAAVLLHTYFSAPAVEDVGNYLDQTRQASERYFASPIHNLLRGYTWGLPMFTLTLLGAIGMLLHIRRAEPDKRRQMGIFFLAAVSFLAGLLATVPLPFQRYSIPLLPFMCWFVGYGIFSLYERMILVTAAKRAAPEIQPVSPAE